MPGESEESLTGNRAGDIKRTLVKKYKAPLIDKLTEQDLRELQFYLKNQFDEKRRINPEYKLKFESKLRQYFHEEILTREIVSIETLVGLLSSEDLKD
jgi:hypothetical protein